MTFSSSLVVFIVHLLSFPFLDEVGTTTTQPSNLVFGDKKRTMKISLVSLICFLTTWQALASSVVPAVDEAVRPRRRHLRKLDELGAFITEAPSMALNETSAAPSMAPDMDTSSGGGAATEAPGDDGEGDDAGTEHRVGVGQQVDDAGGEDTIPPSGGENEGDDVGGNTFGGEETPTSTPTEGEESPTETGEEAPAESPTAGIDESPTVEGGGGDDEDDIVPTPTPTDGRTEYPTAGRPTYDEEPTPSYEPPTYPTPTADYPFSSPSYVPLTPQPYVSTDDEGDPILGPSSGEASGTGGSGSDGYAWDNSTIDQLEHDQTVIIALSVVFGVMFLFSVIVAHQMLDNPHGCCARYVEFLMVVFASSLRLLILALITKLFVSFAASAG